jgi:peptidoglycan/xylan/chitin deacetylase (PgdA/CDA1 family)
LFRYNDNTIGLADSEGILYESGYYTIEGRKYKLDQFTVQTGWITLEDGTKGFANDEGIICYSQVVSIGGKNYSLNANGNIQTGWITLENGNTAYAESDGALFTGYHKIGEYIYVFDSSGNFLNKYLPPTTTTLKQVALTFDDGPSGHTNTILDVLEKYGARATFFVVGDRVGNYPDEIRRIHALGCEVAQHTYSHKYLTKLSLSDVTIEVKKADDEIRSLIGIDAPVFRPPGGLYNSSILSVINKPVIMWSIDTRDWETRTAASVIKNTTQGLQDGDIVLMHDLYGSTAEAIKTIVPELQNQGFELVTVSELAASHGGMENNTVYRSFRN